MFPFNKRQTTIFRLIVINLLLIALAVLWSLGSKGDSVAVAVAKGKQMLDMNLAAAPVIDSIDAQDIAITNLKLTAPQTVENLEFVNAVLLTPGEARAWQASGCGSNNCAYVTFYDHAQGGTVEAVVDLTASKLVASWSNAFARPGGSTWVMPRAFSIAATDPEVQSILGDIGAADPAMVPMSGWLADSACSTEWCVDLSFVDPNETGKIFHVFVNMESNQVERTFYTRGREDRSAAPELSQLAAFSDDCHEQYGWEVCWEMTANDGVDFQNATYQGQTIFRSAKIGQVEAWYPSWPGGYRDEIGYSASVPPFGDTQVTDFGNGFQVSQIFTEFTRWPNCICCYRYEEIMRFYEDGTVDFSFVSHGPGCDDLSIYRPFWHIDVDLDGPEGDEVYLWDTFTWEEQPIEFEEFPIVDDLSSEGQKLATVDGDLNYYWSMSETDPLGRDEGYLFLLQYNENEGEGPITTGPGDTFIPPRQWINGDDLSGENIVLWHVPLLKSSKSEPWWCMPDPDPEFSPCDTTLRAQPGSEIIQLTAEELATMEAEQAELIEQQEQTEQPLPEPSATPAPLPTARPIEGSAPEELLFNAGCTSCHKIGDLGEGHKVGPDLSNIGWLAQGRVEGMAADAYILQSIVDPNVFLAPECPNGPCMENIMPRDYVHRLTLEQQKTIVAYLMTQQTPSQPETGTTATDAQPAPKVIPSAKQAIQTAQNYNIIAFRLASVLLLSLVLLISLLVYYRGESGEDNEES
ncbi:MAG: c-type cytochrome [Candidatus Promineifilaceae bacterium]